MNLPTVRAKCLGKEVTADLPAVWQGRAMVFQCGFFRTETESEDDFSNVTSFELALYRDRIEGVGLVAASATPAMMTTPGALEPAAWDAGTAEHLTFTLTGNEMDLALLTPDEKLWWATRALLDTGELITLGAGYITLREESGAAAGGETLTATLLFSITDDVCSITDSGQIYTLAVVRVGPSTADGLVTVSNETLYFHDGGQRWSAPAVRVDPARAAEGEGMVIDDVLYVTIGGICYSTPVTYAGPAPEVPVTPGELTSVLVTGSDGAEYIQTTFPDGTVRYQPCYEELP